MKWKRDAHWPSRYVEGFNITLEAVEIGGAMMQVLKPSESKE